MRDGTLPQELPWVGDITIDLRARLVENLPILLVNRLLQVQVKDRLMVENTSQDLVGLVDGIHLDGVLISPVEDRATDLPEVQVFHVAVDLDQEHRRCSICLCIWRCVELRKADEVLTILSDPITLDILEERPRLLLAFLRDVASNERIHCRVWWRKRHGDRKLLREGFWNLLLRFANCNPIVVPLTPLLAHVNALDRLHPRDP
mmetsp:Transcript_54498/g.138227  ORF Transcript_54498/g.138227 Transcript_54498/m.138227 type:complete len:204 (+) Transcript_54498:674-1285(+)